MSSYTAALISVCAASSLILMLFSGSRYEKIIRSSVYIIVAMCAISPIAALLQNDGVSSIESEVQRIEYEVKQNTVSSCVREIKNRCKEAITDKFPGTVVHRVEIDYEGDSPEEITIISLDVYVSGTDETEVSEYLKGVFKLDEVKVYTEDT